MTSPAELTALFTRLEERLAARLGVLVEPIVENQRLLDRALDTLVARIGNDSRSR